MVAVDGLEQVVLGTTAARSPFLRLQSLPNNKSDYLDNLQSI